MKNNQLDISSSSGLLFTVLDFISESVHYLNFPHEAFPSRLQTSSSTLNGKRLKGKRRSSVDDFQVRSIPSAGIKGDVSFIPFILDGTRILPQALP